MSASVQRRIISLLATVALLATAAADAYGLHSCPHHDGLPAAHGSAGAASGAHGAAVHGGAAHAGAHTDADLPDGDNGHGPCTCIGACSASTAAAPAAEPHLRLTSLPGAASKLHHADAQPRPATLPHVLPYANAPPLR